MPYGRPDERVVPSAAPRSRVGRLPSTRLGLLAVAAMVIAVWVGIAHFVAPIFGLSADGTGSWTWNLSHAWLALAPGAAALLGAVAVWRNSGRAKLARGRHVIRLAGLLVLACGAWLVMGPVVWPVLEGTRYFLAGDAWGTLIRELAFSMGPGLALAVFGAYALGWVGPARLAAVNSIRHTTAPRRRTVDQVA